MNRTIEWTVLLCFPFVAGCYIPIPARPARVSQMTVIAVASANRSDTTPLRENVGVKNVTGGINTNPILSHSNIGNDEFRGALESSLKLAGLLERNIGEGKFLLCAQLLQVDHPFIGGDMTVATHILYILTDLKSGKEVYQNTISAKYTATISDSFFGVNRLRIANEGSGRENIARLIEGLRQLNISQGDVTLSP